MGLPVSLILIAVGAILAFAVDDDPSRSVDVGVVGWILMAVGLIGLILSMMWWERFGPGAFGMHRGGYGDAPAGQRGYRRRRAVVEEDVPPPPPGPPDAPPPP